MSISHHFAIVFLSMAALALAEPRVDNVLVRMTPQGTTGLVGVHIDQIEETPVYKRLLAGRNLTQLDQFAQDSGFDPRRDVHEVLYATTPKGSVLMARGSFHLNGDAATRGVSKQRHGDYDIWGGDMGGFCILDSTLAIAGDVPAVEAALDEWKSGSHTAAQPLLARVAAVSPQAQFWGISTGLAGFLAEHPPTVAPGLDFSKIFSGLRDTWFEVDLTTGLKAEVHGTTATEKDAISLRDTVRGLVGLGRLQVPEKQPELLRVWDGITVDQQGRSIALHVDIAQDLVDKLVRLLSAGPAAQRGVI